MNYTRTIDPLKFDFYGYFWYLHPGRLTAGTYESPMKGKEHDLPNLHDHVPCQSSGVYAKFQGGTLILMDFGFGNH